MIRFRGIKPGKTQYLGFDGLAQCFAGIFNSLFCGTFLFFVSWKYCRRVTITPITELALSVSDINRTQEFIKQFFNRNLKRVKFNFNALFVACATFSDVFVIWIFRRSAAKSSTGLQSRRKCFQNRPQRTKNNRQQHRAAQRRCYHDRIWHTQKGPVPKLKKTLPYAIILWCSQIT